MKYAKYVEELGEDLTKRYKDKELTETILLEIKDEFYEYMDEETGTDVVFLYNDTYTSVIRLDGEVIKSIGVRRSI